VNNNDGYDRPTPCRLRYDHIDTGCKRGTIHVSRCTFPLNRYGAVPSFQAQKTHV
jgi:hypothetical protein